MKIHFKGLNALRFYAAISVLVQHVMYSPRDWFGVALLPDTLGRFFINGTDAVHLFFVLSGFLITYLLLAEREKSRTVSVRWFYLRRILRIWPLYFMILLLAAFVLPVLVAGYHSPLSDATFTFLMVFFLGNVAYALYYPFPPLEHLWSIAIEEQFYLLIPHLAKSGANLLRLFVGIIVIWCVILVAFSLLPPNGLSPIIGTMRYDCIATGGAFACILYNKHSLLRWIYHPAAWILSLIAIAFMALFIQPTENLPYTISTSFVFGILILNVADNPRFPFQLGHPALEYLGDLSYGIYMYHPLLLLVFFKTFYGKMDLGWYQVAAYPTIMILTIALAALSYRFYEKPFLRLKERFRVVRSHE